MNSSVDIKPSPNLMGFAASAAVAFTLDAGILWSLVQVDIDPLGARIVSMAAALVAGWLVNRTWTYADPSRPSFAEFGRYASSGALSMGVNYTAFALMLIFWPVVNSLEALIIGTLTALAVSFCGYCLAVFNNRAEVQAATQTPDQR
jgi:putative flippase GtrA